MLGGRLREMSIMCVQMYFIWVTASQKQFEWLLDILRSVEDVDDKEIVQTHIFVTQLFHQFDLRTTMLVSCVFCSFATILVLGLIVYITSFPLFVRLIT